MSKMHEDFKVAYREKFGRDPGPWNDVVGKYMDAHASGAWWAWQTAMPRAFGDGWCAGKGIHK